MTPPTQSPDAKTETLRLLSEIAAGIAALREEVCRLTAMIEPAGENSARIAERLDQIGAALAQVPAAGMTSQSQPDAPFCDFHADTILLTYDDAGNAAYKIKGAPFAKFGVRVWPETLPALGIDPAALKPGPNPIAAHVRAVLNPETRKPRKVIGLALIPVAGSAST